MSRKSRMSPFPFLLVLACCGSCARQGDTGEDPDVTAKGSFEITGQLVEIRGQFPNLPNYNCAFVMQYKVIEVQRGKIDAETIYVAHYNPHKTRAAAADGRAEGIGGNLEQFAAGELHRMALEVPIDDYYMGGIVDRYFDAKKALPSTVPIYWAVWTNRVVK